MVVTIDEELCKRVSGEYDPNSIVNLNLNNLAIENIIEISRLSFCSNLIQLNLSGNGITVIQGLEKLVNLQKLILSNNEIRKIENLEKLQSLQHLHLQQNRIEEAEQVAYLVQNINLKSLYLCNNGNNKENSKYNKNSNNNPCCRKRNYREIVIQYLPNLMILDGIHVNGEAIYKSEILLRQIISKEEEKYHIRPYQNWLSNDFFSISDSSNSQNRSSSIISNATLKLEIDKSIHKHEELLKDCQKLSAGANNIITHYSSNSSLTIKPTLSKSTSSVLNLSGSVNAILPSSSSTQQPLSSRNNYYFGNNNNSVTTMPKIPTPPSRHSNSTANSKTLIN